jgi:glutaredoxin
VPGRRPRVVVYTRTGCGLCRRAEDLVAREARRTEVTHVDVDTDEALVARYGVRVPVVTVDDVEVAELELSPGTVRRAVRAARRGGPAAGQRGDHPAR